MKFLNKITGRYENTLLNNFKKRFISRYEEQEVPLMEAIDSESGIGYPQNESKVYNPLIADLHLPTRHTSTIGVMSRLSRLLMNKIANSVNRSCIVISDEDIKDFPDYPMSDLPVTVAAVFKMVSDFDNRQLMDGLFFTGISAANLLGRFAYGDSAVRQIVSDVMGVEQKAYGDKIVAEISHLPASRTGNVIFRPHIREYEIEYLAPSVLRSDKAIPVSDLMVSVCNNMIRLRSKTLDKIVVPRLTNAHNYSNSTTPVYRFLCDLQTQGLRSSLRFTWGGLGSSLEHLPRVMYKDLIVSRECWRCSAKDFKRRNKVDHDLFAQWRGHLQLPRYVQLVDGDNILPVDLDNVMSVNAFISELSNIDNFILEEFLFPSDGCNDKDGHVYMNECIIPLMRVK